MKLNENPIFLTQKRLVHRAGVVAPVFIGLLIGLSMLAALGYHLALEAAVRDSPDSPTKLGHLYYAWLLFLQAAVLVVGGFSRISRTLVEERKAGLVDGNRLTPLTGSQLVVGYWLGSALREFYIAAALAPIGLAMITIAKLPLALWLGTQLLLFSSALFFGVLGVLAGMAMPRAQGGMGLVVLIVFILPATLVSSRFSITNFLLPVYATVQLFHPTGYQSERWESPVDFFAVTVPPLVYTFLLQILLGILAWRGAVRKFGNPSRPAFVRWEVRALFGLLVLLQYGLIWHGLQRDLPFNEAAAILGFVHGSALLVGIILLGPQALDPEEARIAALRRGVGTEGRILWESAPCTAVILAVIASAGLLTQLGWNLRYLLASLNALVVFLTFSLSLELCRLQFRKRAVGAFALVLFILYGLPFLLSLTFATSVPMKFSFASPGIAAITEDADELRTFAIITVGHYVIAVALVYFWMTRWRRWLGKKAAISNP